MTSYTKFNGTQDAYDERVIEDIIQSVEDYIKVKGKMPPTTGISPYQMTQVRKAQDAGVHLVVQFKGAPCHVSVSNIENYYNIALAQTKEKKRIARSWN